jgi:hypothetical protein
MASNAALLPRAVHVSSTSEGWGWWPGKNGAVSASFPSFVCPVLTEIHLYHACSCQEIFRMETARQVCHRGKPSQWDGQQVPLHHPLDPPRVHSNSRASVCPRHQDGAHSSLACV